MKYFIFIVSIITFLSVLCNAQDKNPFISFGLNGGSLISINSGNTDEYKNGYIYGLQVAFNFNKHISITFDCDYAIRQKKKFPQTEFYDEHIQEYALGVRYVPLNTRLTPFGELQLEYIGYKRPDAPLIVNHETFANLEFHGGVNIGAGAQYSVFKQLDAVFRIKFNTYNFVGISAGVNYNINLK